MQGGGWVGKAIFDELAMMHRASSQGAACIARARKVAGVVAGRFGLLPLIQTHHGTYCRMRQTYDRLRETPFERRGRLDEAHLRQLLAWTLTEDANCVDVGANVGSVLREVLRCAPHGQHIAFEPLPDLYARLCQDFPSVQVHCLALANEAGETTFHYVRSAPAYSGLRERTYPSPQQVELIPVRTARLDEVLSPDYRPRLIKIDVEGGEFGVLRGAIRTLTTYRPIVVFEHGAGGREFYGTTAEDVWTLLVDEAKLRIFDLDGNGPYDLTQFGEESSTRRWNFVAVP
jgi:FkbM family methyltransferase